MNGQLQITWAGYDISLGHSVHLNTHTVPTEQSLRNRMNAVDSIELLNYIYIQFPVNFTTAH